MKVLFVYPNIVESPKDISLGLASLSAVLKKNGHEISLIDTTFGMSDKEILNKALKFKPNLIAITTATNDFNYAQHIASLLKKLRVPIVVGGYHPTIAPLEAIKKNCFDIVCVGEGEYPLLELVKSLEKGKIDYKIKNLWFKKNGKIIKNPIRPLILNLDELPFSDREIYDYKKYLKWNRGTATFLTTRGCPYQCTYCINHYLQKIYSGKGRYTRFRSVDNILKEIKLVISKYKPRYIEFYDDTFTLDKNRIREFSKRYKEIRIPFYVNIRVNSVDKETLRLLKEAGCVRVSIGVESGDPYIRNEILKRDMTDQQIIDTFKWCKEIGLETYSFNMIGVPFETKQSIRKTIELNKKLKPDYIGVSIFNAYKGTELYEMCKKNNWLKNKDAISYFKETNIKHPNFSEKQLKNIRDSFGFNVFIKERPLRAIIDLTDRKFANVPYYTLLRSNLLTKFRSKLSKI